MFHGGPSLHLVEASNFARFQSPANIPKLSLGPGKGTLRRPEGSIRGRPVKGHCGYQTTAHSECCPWLDPLACPGYPEHPGSAAQPLREQHVLQSSADTRAGHHLAEGLHRPAQGLGQGAVHGLVACQKQYNKQGT